MLIPLAVFCLAQLSAMLDKKTSFFMMLLISFLFVSVGLLLSSPIFLGSGIFVLFSVPFFLPAIFLREKRKSIIFPAFILLLPVVSSLLLFCFVLPSEPHFLSELEQSFRQMNLDGNSEQILMLRQFFQYSGWQRLIWFVFGAGSYPLFVTLLVSFANLALIDFAFEKVDRLKAVNPTGWNLKQFVMPFPLVLFSIAFMALIAFAFGGFDSILSHATQNSFWLHAFPIVGLFSLVVLSILTLQGMSILYLRLPSFLMLLLFFCVFILVPRFSFGPYALVAVFGTISILDSVYDWRGKKV